MLAVIIQFADKDSIRWKRAFVREIVPKAFRSGMTIRVLANLDLYLEKEVTTFMK